MCPDYLCMLITDESLWTSRFGNNSKRNGSRGGNEIIGKRYARKREPSFDIIFEVVSKRYHDVANVMYIYVT